MDTIEKLKSGDVLTIAQMISRVEEHDPEAMEIIRKIYSRCGRAHLIGITGPPGAGKSCLVSALVNNIREKGKTVGVLAIDPSSPISGGAFLGDRARLTGHLNDEGVYYRSLASRGSSGGLSAAVNDAIDLLDFSGKDIVLIETVGVGQSEIEIAQIAHTVILTMMPGCGDQVQALKAGIIEIADILVINKFDRPGADATRMELEALITHPDDDPESWNVAVMPTIATEEKGIEELVEKISDHEIFLQQTGQNEKKTRKRRVKQFLNLLSERLQAEFLGDTDGTSILASWAEKVSSLQLDPYSASDQLMEQFIMTRQ